MIEALLGLAAFATILTTIGILASLASGTLAFFSEIPVANFLFGTEWTPLFLDGSFGVLPILSGTLQITLVAITLAIPLGLGAAMYLSEFASPTARRIFKPVLEVLAGIPTVVYGFFAIAFVTPNIVRPLWFGGNPPGVFSALSAGLVMGVLIIPIVASLSEDALSSVPQSMRDGAFALGASRARVARKVVLPAALSGVIASFVLALSRAIGETLIVLVAAGGLAQLTFSIQEPMLTMTAFIATAATGDTPTGSIEYNTLFAVGTLLFLITLFVNVVSIRLVRRFREVYE